MRRDSPVASGERVDPAAHAVADPAAAGGPPAAVSGPSLRVKALAWLALREHSTQELRTKLQRWAQARGRDAAALRPGVDQGGKESGDRGGRGMVRRSQLVPALIAKARQHRAHGMSVQGMR